MEVDGPGVRHDLTRLIHIGGAEIQDNIWKVAVSTETEEMHHKNTYKP